MTFATKARLLYHIARWLMTRNRLNTHYRFTVPGNPKFMGPRDAVKLIPDGAVLGTSGLGATQWASIMYRTLHEVFAETGHPRGLTVVAIGGQGSRGRSPGSIEELGLAGLCTRFFTSHTETFKSLLRLADAGQLELQCIPQGILAFLIEAQGRGEDSLLTTTGLGTFVDPRVGRGTPVVGAPATGGAEQWVSVEEDKLRFRLPKINVAVFNAPSADREGNIYVKNCAMTAESAEIAKAARKNNGIVIANVGLVVEQGCDEVFLPADAVDAVVVYPGTEQVGSISHRKYWRMFTTHSDVPISEGIARLKFINQVVGITPRRSEIDNALARLAATTFAEHVAKGCLVNIGVGLPEEVCRLIVAAGLFDDIRLFTESGVIGGLPAPGVFFGTAVCPERVISSAQVFHLCNAGLDVSILGMLQVDSDGNVNVSKRGEGAINYVGPGGFIDFTTAAKTVIFVGSWMVRGKMAIENGRLRILERGQPKFIRQVDEITFSGRQALENGRRIFYVTNVGVFQLTARGLELIGVTPGIDVRKDIIDFASAQIVLPESGQIPAVDPSVMTGKDFRLRLRERNSG